MRMLMRDHVRSPKIKPLYTVGLPPPIWYEVILVVLASVAVMSLFMGGVEMLLLCWLCCCVVKEFVKCSL